MYLCILARQLTYNSIVDFDRRSFPHKKLQGWEIACLCGYIYSRYTILKKKQENHINVSILSRYHQGIVT